MHPEIAIYSDGGTLWLACFADNPDADRGEIICEVQPGSRWFEMAEAVDRHIVEHGC